MACPFRTDVWDEQVKWTGLFYIYMLPKFHSQQSTSIIIIIIIIKLNRCFFFVNSGPVKFWEDEAFYGIDLRPLAKKAYEEHGAGRWATRQGRAISSDCSHVVDFRPSPCGWSSKSP